MRLHHLNCTSTCPLGGKLFDGRSTGLRGKLACRCILLETASGLVLIDTGLGLRDLADPRARLSRFFLALLDPDFRVEMTAIRQVQALGFKAHDVRHIVLTHLDFDHAGGLDDFPEARIHMMREELVDAPLQRTWLDRQRYRPQQWSSMPRWVGYDVNRGERWFGFRSVHELRGIPPEIVLVPLRGHTLGHAGVAVRQDGGDWLLLAGDAYFDGRELDLDHPRCLPGLALYQRMMEKDARARHDNQRRLRELLRDHGDRVRIACSHDPHELERDTGRPLDTPVIAAPREPRPLHAVP